MGTVPRDIGRPATPQEVTAVLGDLSWLEACTCGQLPLAEFFVAAGHVLSDHARDVARRCPVRRQEVIFAYGRGIRWGYYGALSPGQRSAWSLDEALAHLATDTPDTGSGAA